MKNLERIKIYDVFTEELNRGKDVYFSVRGESMYPTIKNGETVKLLKKEKIKRGDIIAYYLENNSDCKIFVHRVVFLRSRYVLAKGDNSTHIDPLRIPYENILGKVELVEKSILFSPPN